MTPPQRIDRFSLGELLGEGGTGAVYAARDEHGNEVALKLLYEHNTADAEVVERFRREALIASQLRSEYVLPALASGSEHDGQILWIAYPRLYGETLQQRLARERALPAAAAGPIIQQLLRGLEATHALGIIHRDVKPSNIFLESAGEGATHVRLLDFGISKLSASGDSVSTLISLTSTLASLGTVAYMPPEQFGDAANVDARADLYSAGLTAFRILAGVLPFGGKSEVVLLQAKLCRPPTTLGVATKAGWPEEADHFFAQALAPNAEERFAGAGEMLTAWMALIERTDLPHPHDFDRSVFAAQEELAVLEARGVDATIPNATTTTTR